MNNIFHIFIKGLMFFLCIFLSFFANCQTDTVHLKEVEVKERYQFFPGINKSYCDTLHIIQSVSANLGEILSYEPGLTVKRFGDGSLATVSFRGTDPSHTKVEWNGMPVNSIMNGQVDFSLIPACPTDRINLLYGANSLAYKSGALGGMISLNSANTENLKHGLELRQETGSFGLNNSYLGLVLGKKMLKSFTRLSYHKSDNDFEYQNTAILPVQKMRQKNAAFERLDLMQELLLQNGFHEFSVHFWQNSAFRYIPPLMTNVFSVEHNETQNDQATRVLAAWNYRHNCYSSFIKQGFTFNSLNYHLNHYSGSYPVTFINSESKEKQYFASAGTRYCLSNNVQLNASLDYSFQKAEIFEEMLGQGYNVSLNVLDGMADIEVFPYRWFNITALTRIKKQQNNEPAFIPAVFFSFRPVQSVVIKTALSHNVNFPALNDLYFIPGGNTELKTEKGLQSDLNVEYNYRFGRKSLKNDFKTELDFFYTDIINWILWQPTQFGFWTPQNIRQVISKGLQTKSSFRINLQKTKIFLQATYTYNLATAIDDGYITEQLPYLPKHSGNLSAKINLSDFEFFAEEIYTDTRITSYYGSYSHNLESTWLTNISASYLIKLMNLSFTAGFRLNNLFNKNYQMVLWRPMPNRNGSIVITIKI
ncbi:MAG: hypothetical protein COX07_07345 [Bacteroidetes bacterium CG23_combo_of_CG06-09_8_20_14_all_32_9]|nr:MAG: hypothetical protein COX07_07345 [Bacteroidetes bacterium CG23_combo_of_CG06-09_8_20_14_all_32_9]